MAVNLPKDITLQMLEDNYKTAANAFSSAHKRMALLQAIDNGKLWEALDAKFPEYQILPDTNHVNSIKEAIVASIYTVGKEPHIIPTSKADQQAVFDLNIALGHIWEKANVPYFQLQAGNNAALMNLGITQVGWGEELSGGNASDMYRANVTFKNIDPMKFLRDPYASSLETSAYCITWDIVHKNVLLKNPNYAAEIQKLINEGSSGQINTEGVTEVKSDKPDISQAASKGNLKLVIHWVRIGENVHEIHTINNERVIFVKESIKPATFPFALLYCTLPGNNLIGSSAPSKILSNSVAYNLMNSLMYTAEYKNQRPPKFVSNQAGLNINKFLKHGNDADYTFLVNGAPQSAVHYQDFPKPSAQAYSLNQNANIDIEKVSGVNARYTGRETGSITTTGGMEQAISQVTLIDMPKIVQYEAYSKRLAELVMSNMLEFSPKRTYLISDPNNNAYNSVEIDYPAIQLEDALDYSLEISSYLPRNKERLAQVADMLMEKQMQYGQNMGGVDLITPEEWLMLQDFPNKEFMTERMKLQRNTELVDLVSQAVATAGALMEQGAPADEAIQQTADMMQQGMEQGNIGTPDMSAQNMQQPVDMGMSGML